MLCTTALCAACVGTEMNNPHRLRTYTRHPSAPSPKHTNTHTDTHTHKHTHTNIHARTHTHTPIHNPPSQNRRLGGRVRGYPTPTTVGRMRLPTTGHVTTGANRAVHPAGLLCVKPAAKSASRKGKHCCDQAPFLQRRRDRGVGVQFTNSEKAHLAPLAAVFRGGGGVLDPSPPGPRLNERIKHTGVNRRTEQSAPTLENKTRA